MRITSDLILRLSLFLTLLILITPPFNNWLKLITLSSITVIIFSSKLDQKKIKKKIFLIPLILIIGIKFYSQNYSFIVNHIVLPTKSTENYNYIKNTFDKSLYLIFEDELKKLSNKEILLDNIKQPGESDRSTLFRKFAFQSENIWTFLDEGKYINQ